MRQPQQIKVERISAINFLVNHKPVKAYGNIVSCEAEEDLTIKENAALNLFIRASRKAKIQSSIFQL